MVHHHNKTELQAKKLVNEAAYGTAANTASKVFKTLYAVPKREDIFSYQVS